MNLVGINAYYGDAAAVVFADGRLLLAADEVCFSRTKRAAGLPISKLYTPKRGFEVPIGTMFRLFSFVMLEIWCREFLET